MYPTGLMAAPGQLIEPLTSEKREGGGHPGSPQIVKRTGAHRFVVLPKRWIVERVFAWLAWPRRLSKDYEHLTASSEAMIKIAMIHLWVKRLA